MIEQVLIVLYYPVANVFPPLPTPAPYLWGHDSLF